MALLEGLKNRLSFIEHNLRAQLQRLSSFGSGSSGSGSEFESVSELGGNDYADAEMDLGLEDQLSAHSAGISPSPRFPF